MRQTIKLYEQNSHRREFFAQVLDCVPAKEGFDVVLDQTAFYPEGGGQSYDLGTLGGVEVTQVHEREGIIYHRCKEALEPGSFVPGSIDWPRRLEHSQHHSGEHIVSGLIHQRFGYHNVGFHMGAESVMIDFDGPIEPWELQQIEDQANRAVWENLPVRCWYPEPEELAGISYRSKKALTGAVRLVEIPGCDLCACCGTHVMQTGEIGIIKLLSCVKFHQGVRIELLCGSKALAYLSRIWEQNRLVSQTFSAKPLQTGEAAKKMMDTANALKQRLAAMENRVFASVADGYAGKGDVCHFEPDLTPDGVRRLADAIGQSCGGRAIVVSGTDGEGYQYAMCQPGADLRSLNKRWTEALSGRGGGKPFFQQGSIRGTRREILDFLAREAN